MKESIKQISNFLEEIKEKPTISFKEINKRLKQVVTTLESEETVKPCLLVDKLQKYDVVRTLIGPCFHYAIVIAVLENGNVLGLIITTKDHFEYSMPIISRLFKGNILLTPIEISRTIATENFICTFDNIPALKQIMKGSKNRLQSIIKEFY